VARRCVGAATHFPNARPDRYRGRHVQLASLGSLRPDRPLAPRHARLSLRLRLRLDADSCGHGPAVRRGQQRGRAGPRCALRLPRLAAARSGRRPHVCDDDVRAGRALRDRRRRGGVCVVANLDDDNGDGLIDARDFPEIVFMTYCNSTSTNAMAPCAPCTAAAPAREAMPSPCSAPITGGQATLPDDATPCADGHQPHRLDRRRRSRRPRPQRRPPRDHRRAREVTRRRHLRSHRRRADPRHRSDRRTCPARVANPAVAVANLDGKAWPRSSSGPM
jgi:hypothetical protein